jgi:hypothetical protein
VADNGFTTSEEAKPPASRPVSGDPPGLRAQLGATASGAKRLVSAHINLAKAEAGDIVGEVKRMVGLAGMAIAVLILAAMLLVIGGMLFLGEWLFGSIGWGVLLGTLLLVDVALMALLLALDVKGGRLGSSLLIAAAVGVAIGLVLGFDLPHRGWQALGEAVAPTINATDRTVNLAVGVSAAVLGLLGFVLGLRGGLKSAIIGLVALGIVGALIGWLTSGAVALQLGAALGVLVTLILWPVLAGLDLMRTGVDGEALMNRFKPTETIELTKETIEWVRARTPLAPKS